MVYVRQSTNQQVLEHRESLARQYALRDYAALLGWPAERILLIDGNCLPSRLIFPGARF